MSDGPLQDPFTANVLNVAAHVRRYRLLYAIGLVAVLAAAVVPAVTLVGGGQPVHVRASGAGGQSTAQASGASTAGSLTGGATGPDTGAASAGGTPQAQTSAQSSGGTSSSGGGGGGNLTNGGGSGGVQVGTGVTRGGFPCTQSTRQLPFSQYADPCVAKFAGGNGGSTYNGVTADSITIAVRHTSDSTGANAAAGQAEVEAAGGDSTATVRGYTTKLVDYFNKTFELYGRQVKLVDYNGQGNGTNESLGQGQAAACADADQAANTVHAFGDINYGGNFESGPFSDCAAKYHLYVPEGSAYFPESAYQADHPFVWGITMNCSMIAQEEAEFVGKDMAPYPAKWAGMDGAFNMAGAKRKFGTYVPNNAGYQSCTTEAVQTAEQKYHVAPSQEDQYNYALDISTFPQDAQKAIVQFAANHDTTVVLACDPISPIFLTQDAVQQNYNPEWMLIGVALTDSDNWAQLWDQKAVTGRLFGMSQAGATQTMLDPHGEGCTALSNAGVPCDPSTVVDYYELISMFNQLQAAGPNLSPANIAAGSKSLPMAGGQSGASGTWHFGDTHTAIIDSRLIYWNANQTSPANNKQGTYIAINNGQRYQQGQFPTGQQPFYS